MNSRRHLLLLIFSILAFAGMVILISVSVTDRRRNRDFVFGLERLDALISQDRIDEAAPMVAWLASRAPDATGGLSVMKRGLELLDTHEMIDPLDAAAVVLVDRFAGNNTIRAVAVFAAVRAGDLERASQWSGRYLAEENTAVFAWTLLLSGSGPERLVDSEDSAEEGPLFLARLGHQASEEDMERAWRSTGDWRYGSNAAVMHMQHGEITRAAQTASGASLSLHNPRLATDIFADAGDFDSALRAMRTIPTDGQPSALVRKADLLMAVGRHEEAREVYERVITSAPLESDIPYLNLAWLTRDSDTAMGLYQKATELFPGSWRAFEQRALGLAKQDVGAAYESLAGYSGPRRSAYEQLLRLKLDSGLDRPGYEAAVWDLVYHPDAPAEAFRYAAWYFAGRGQFDDLEDVLRLAPADSAWVKTYQGYLAAAHGDWIGAAGILDQAFSADPGWQTAYNSALALMAAGDPNPARERLVQAGDLAQTAGYPEASAAIYVSLARITDDRGGRFNALQMALEIDPDNMHALLLLARLESGSPN